MRLLLFCAILAFASCKDKQLTDNSWAGILRHGVDVAETDVEKVKALSKLSWYYMELDVPVADSIMRSAYALALNSTAKNKEPLILCYLLDAERHMLLDDFKNHLDTAAILASKAADIAGRNNLPVYEAYSFIDLGQTAFYAGNPKAVEDYFSRASVIANANNDDSLKMEVYCASSQVYQDMRLVNYALTNASLAETLAEKTENKSFRLRAFRRMGTLYNAIDSVHSEENFRKYVELSKTPDRTEDLINGYMALGKYYLDQPSLLFEAYQYLDSARTIAEKFNHDVYRSLTTALIIEYYFKQKQPDSALSLLNKYERQGQGKKNGKLLARYYYRLGRLKYELGDCYRLLSQNNNADNYYRKAFDNFIECKSVYNLYATDSRLSMLKYYYGVLNYELYFLNKYRAKKFADGYMSHADSSDSYMLTRMYTEADQNFFEAQQLHVKLNDPESLKNILSWRESLARDSMLFYYDVNRGQIYSSRRPAGEYAVRAWAALKIYDSCVDVLQKYKDAKMQIRIENDKTSRLAAIGKEKEEHRNTIKQIGIILTLVLVFIGLIMTGYLKASRTVVQGLNFFAFIFLFEFLLMLSEKWMHEITHGEMVSSLLLKILLAIVIVPVHHYLEEKMMHRITKVGQGSAGSH